MDIDNSAIHERNRNWKAEWDKAVLAAEKARGAGDEKAARRFKKEADRILEVFFKANSGLAYAAARKHLSKHSASNHEDYLQEARLAMVRAFPDWDPDRGTFATFSRIYAEGLVNRAVASYERPGITYGDHTATPHARSAEIRLRERLGRGPTYEEIAEEAGLSIGVTRRALAPRVSSLDTPIGDGENSRMDLTQDAEDELADNPVGESYEIRLEDERWQRILSELDAQQLAVVVRRFGFDGAPDQVHAEIGELIDISREAARRAEIDARETISILL